MRTSATLILDVRMGKTEAWNEFVLSYRPSIVAWCRRFGAQPAEAEDIAQNVLLKLIDKIRAFKYDPSKGFRKWLRTVTRHAWLDYVDSIRRSGRGIAQTEFWLNLHNPATSSELEQAIEQTWQREMVDQAMAQVKTEVHETTWRAFELLAIEGKKSPEVAGVLNMTPGAVLMAKYRVTKRIRELVGDLESDPYRE